MTSSTQAPTGRRRRPQVLTQAFTVFPQGGAEQSGARQGGAESVHHRHARTDERAAQDPPIYRALLAHWAERGRTLPGRHDPEWERLAAPPARRFSDSPGPAADGR